MSGSPKFQYHIPFAGENPIHDHWHVIITSTSKHFYFNSAVKKSLWQLADIQQQYQDLPWTRFVACINFDQLAILFAKARGLKGLDESHYYRENQTREKNKESLDKEVNKDNDVKKPAQPEPSNPSEVEHESQLELEVDFEAQNAFIADLLKEEGYIKPQEKVILGYSSSEEESEGEDDGDEGDEGDEADEGEDLSNGLDLSLPDDTSLPTKSEFFDVLNQLKPKISIYEPWSMVEEELISELALFPAFYAIDGSQRELIFDEWCAQQEDTLPNEPELAQKYPTPTIVLYKLFQEYKRDIKLLYYQQFFNQHIQEFNEIDLSNKEKEKLYAKFKTMLSDFSKFERAAKKEKLYDSSVNLKKLRLQQFLSEHKEWDKKGQVEKKDHSFDTWIAILNDCNVPEHIAESNINFIVGDDKRLECYEEIVS